MKRDNKNTTDALYTMSGAGTQTIFVMLCPQTLTEAGTLLHELEKRFVVYTFVHGKNTLFANFFGNLGRRIQKAVQTIKATAVIDCIITDRFSILHKSLMRNEKHVIGMAHRQSLVFNGKTKASTYFLTYAMLKENSEINSKIFAAGLASMYS